MLVDEQVWLTFACQAQHRVVKVFNPSAHGLAIAQLDGDDNLTVAERTKVERLLPGFSRWRRLGAAARGQWRSHVAILDAPRRKHHASPSRIRQFLDPQQPIKRRHELLTGDLPQLEFS